MRNNRHLWGEQYNRNLADILSIQQQISTEISNNLRPKLSGVRQLAFRGALHESGTPDESCALV
ncbi:MAG TPA: hypothetical protein VKT49_22390 [Bryobacteraceae bacterium]|nr:hypothetical protein [Bryobacteraceae bacterium]